MKNRIVLTLVGGLWLSIANFSVSLAADQPNIILILIDDLGWKDLGCYGNEFVETPRIDQLALEGIRFTDFYASGAVCSPTRCALQSGQNQARIGITAHIPGHWRPFERVITPQTTMALPLDIVTVAEALKTVNYTTGYVGKWHLCYSAGRHADIHGFRYVDNIRSNGADAHNVDAAVKFLDEERSDPFFLVASFNNPHNICEWARSPETGAFPDIDVGSPPHLSDRPPPLGLITQTSMDGLRFWQICEKRIRRRIHFLWVILGKKSGELIAGRIIVWSNRLIAKSAVFLRSFSVVV